RNCLFTLFRTEQQKRTRLGANTQEPASLCCILASPDHAIFEPRARAGSLAHNRFLSKSLIDTINLPRWAINLTIDRLPMTQSRLVVPVGVQTVSCPRGSL